MKGSARNPYDYLIKKDLQCNIDFISQYTRIFCFKHEQNNQRHRFILKKKNERKKKKTIRFLMFANNAKKNRYLLCTDYNKILLLC